MRKGGTYILDTLLKLGSDVLRVHAACSGSTAARLLSVLSRLLSVLSLLLAILTLLLAVLALSGLLTVLSLPGLLTVLTLPSWLSVLTGLLLPVLTRLLLLAVRTLLTILTVLPRLLAVLTRLLTILTGLLLLLLMLSILAWLLRSVLTRSLSLARSGRNARRTRAVRLLLLTLGRLRAVVPSGAARRGRTVLALTVLLLLRRLAVALLSTVLSRSTVSAPSARPGSLAGEAERGSRLVGLCYTPLSAVISRVRRQ